MKRILQRILILCVTVSLSLATVALDLPIKKHKGKQMYYYKVEKNETVYGISKRLGLSREEIIKHNPSVAKGVKKGMRLYFPVEEYAYHNPVDFIDADSIVADSITIDSVAPIPKKRSIALLLPFGLDAAEQSRSCQLALDFYKGFLLGVDTLAQQSDTVQIHVFDTASKNYSLNEILEKKEVSEAAIIVSPGDASAFKTIAAKAAERNSYVFNVFIVADTLNRCNKMVLQANIPQRQMYRLAADAFLKDFEGYVPVVLRNKVGRNEKEAFVEYLCQRFAEKEITPITIEYNDILLGTDLEQLPILAGEKYIAIPSSGSLVEFNKFAPVIKSFRDKLTIVDTEAPGYNPSAPLAKMALFGYPDWTAFRGEALYTLHQLEATVYSRFFDDFAGAETRFFESKFKQWYGSDIIETVPSQARLGFDTSRYLIENLNANDGVFNPENPVKFEGLQSAFEFEKNGEGYSNATLYIINYLIDGQINERTL